jgi:dienelactone hydrolase
MQLIRRICISSIIHCFTGSSLLYLDHKTNLEVKIMGILFILLLTLMESTLLYLSLHGKRNFEEERGILNFSILLLLILFFLTGVFTWSFRFMPITLLVAIKSLVSLVGLLRRREKSFRKGKTILKAAVNLLLYIAAASVLILFPPYLQPEVTGTFEVKTEKYTWTDEDRKDAFSTEDSRRLTVELYYPETSEGNFPLVVFSHGAFGFSGSNYSTFAELASHGYVVASIGHTGHAFYTLDTSGTLTTVDPDFINKAAEINGITDTQHEAEIFETTQSWLKLRVEDEHFVLERILEEASSAEKGTVFSLIDCENIGLMGHSLGGATSAEIGRLRPDIDAVIVLDGTMLG